MVQTVKHAEDQARLEKELAEKAKSIENKAMQRAKVTQEIKECIEQSSKSQTLQKTIRKEMQERKLHHLQQQFGKIREKLLEKCRDSELQLKPGVDFLQLKLKLESEMRKNK